MVKSIIEGFEGYKQIVNKEIHYVYFDDSVYREIILKAQKVNFMHLCGVKYKRPGTRVLYSATQFWNALDKKQLSKDGLITKQDGTTEQKLQVFDSMRQLTNCNLLRIINHQTSYLNLSFSAGIRSRKQIFCLALEQSRSGSFVPTSFLNIQRNPSKISKGFPVHCIYYIDGIGHLHNMCKSKEFIQFELSHSYSYSTGIIPTTR